MKKLWAVVFTSMNMPSLPNQQTCQIQRVYKKGNNFMNLLPQHGFIPDTNQIIESNSDNVASMGVPT